MKKLLLMLVVVASVATVQGQSLQLSAGYEFTVKTPQLQLTGGYVTKAHWAMGMFYQSSGLTPRSADDAYTGKQEFYGVYVNAPLYSCEKVNLAFQVRSGLASGNFVVIVPSIETTLNVSKYIGFGISTGVRYTYPSVAFKAYIRPFAGHRK